MRVRVFPDMPEVIEGKVEFDEAYPGGQWINKRLSIKRSVKKQNEAGEQRNWFSSVFCARQDISITTKGSIPCPISHGKNEYFDVRGITLMFGRIPWIA